MATESDPAQLVKSITDDILLIVRGEIELAKAELVPQAKSAGLAAGLFGGAAVVAAIAAAMLFVAAGLGVGAALAVLVGPIGGAALGFLVVAVALLILAALMGVVGSRSIKTGGAPEATSQANESITAVKAAIASGFDSVKNRTTRAALTRTPE
jgi:hypothetical protein